ncbi:MAG TPA: serine hydrolase [Candidatus Limnocylindrales bacterium]
MKIEAEGWHSWALLDHKDGAIVGSQTQAEVARTCSVIKVWLAADYLRRAAEKGSTPSSSKLSALSKMIRNSDNAVATTTFAELGKTACFTRLMEMCQLTDFKAAGSWGQCQMSARDLARLGATVMNGTAAGPKWTEWLLNEMRLVKLGTWGIREAFPAEQAAALAIKNGWDTTSATQTKHMNCMAVTQRWTMITMTKYPIAMPDRHGQEIDKNVAAQLLQSNELEPLFKAA